MKKSYLYLILTLVLLLYGCDNSSMKTQPLVLFGSEGCGLGCWQGLRLGMPQDEVSHYFAENLPNRFQEFEVEGTVFYNGVAEFSVQSYILESELHAISLGTGSKFDLTLQEVMDELGTPSFLHWDYQVAGEFYDVFPYIYLYYPEQGYVFYVLLPHQNRRAQTANDPVTMCPQPDSHINHVYIVYPDTIEQVIHDVDFFTAPTQVDRILNNLVSWTGFECRTLNH